MYGATELEVAETTVSTQRNYVPLNCKRKTNAPMNCESLNELS